MVSTRSGLSTQAANVLVALAQVAWLTGRVADLKAIIANLRALVASLATQRDTAQQQIVVITADRDHYKHEVDQARALGNPTAADVVQVQQAMTRQHARITALEYYLTQTGLAIDINLVAERREAPLASLVQAEIANALAHKDDDTPPLGDAGMEDGDSDGNV